VKDKLVINFVDGILGMEGEGPSAGVPRNFGVLFASESASALDCKASEMMGFKIESLPYIKYALDIDKVLPEEIQTEKKIPVFSNVQIKELSPVLKILAYSPEFIRKGFRKLFYFYPAFTNDCKKCNVCVDSCPMDVMTLTKDMVTPEIDLSKCIKCMCCHELCPHNAVYVKKSFLAKYVLK
jgi:ferredoxin